MPSVTGELLDSEEEPHAVAIGAGLGAAAVVSGQSQALVAAVTVAWAAARSAGKPPDTKRQHVLRDIKREPHYFFAGVALGVALGTAARLAMGHGLPVVGRGA